MKISIVVPCLDEAGSIAETLRSLSLLRERGHEVIVVDGGSRDATEALARPHCDRFLQAPRGRALQMNAGAAAASGEALVFLHADTLLPTDADRLVEEALRQRCWGRFDVRIDGPHPMLAVVAAAMNARSRLTGIATGDQAIFVRRDAFPGFPAIALMEDVAFSKAMKRLGRPACLRARVRTSGRRWERRGVLRTIALMWGLRLAFFLGASPESLRRRYEA